MNVPDYVSPIIGHRVWQWDDVGLTSLNGQSWPPGQPLAAECKRVPGHHRTPQIDCTCGIYAAKDLEQLRAMRLHPHGMYGEVYLWGTIVEHSFGWRAQFAYPKSLALPSESLLFGRFVQREMSTGEVEARLAALTAYGADIFVAAEKENVRLWSKHSGYDSDGLSCVRGAATQPLASVLIAVLTEGRSPHTLVQNGFEVTHPAEIVFTEVRFPLSPSDPIIRQIQHRRARVVALNLTVENVQGTLNVVEMIRRIGSHLAVAVRGELPIPLRLMFATQLNADAWGSQCSYDVLDTFAYLSGARSKTSAPDRGGPPTAPVYAPLSRGPHPMRPREVALAI